MIHLGDIGPARIRHVHVGVLLKEKREHHRLLSGKHGMCPWSSRSRDHIHKHFMDEYLQN